MEAHRKGTLHRAFSILVFNSKNQLLLQKRNVKNIIRLVSGQIRAVVIQDTVKVYMMRFIEGLRKKWVLHVNLKKYLVLFIK